jgi:hypothetical protein
MIWVASAALTVWIHVTNVVFVTAALVVIAGLRWRELLLLARRRPVSATGLVIAAVVAAAFAKRWREFKPLWQSARTALDRLPRHLEALGDILFGPRVYTYLAGVPEPAITEWLYAIALAAVLAALVVLARYGSYTDQALALLSVVTFGIVLLVARRLDVDATSYERYFLYLIPSLALLVVRNLRLCTRATWLPRWLPPLLPLLMSLLFEIQFWQCYFAPLKQQTYAEKLHRTFRTSRTEPKQDVAKLLKERLALDPEAATYAEDWWLVQPLTYLLGKEHPVTLGGRPADSEGRAFIAVWSTGGYLNEVWADLGTKYWLNDLHTFSDPAGRSTVLLFDVSTW